MGGQPISHGLIVAAAAKNSPGGRSARRRAVAAARPPSAAPVRGYNRPMEVLRRGDRGDAVLALQQSLGLADTPDSDEPGAFGPCTEAAVVLLQRAAGLVIDGTVGPQTRAALATPPPSRPLLRVRPDVPYRSQRDNAHDPLSTCNVTSLAMALLHRGVYPRRPDLQLEDELFELLHGPEAAAYYREASPDLFAHHIPVHEVHDNLAWAARQYGVPATFDGHRSRAALRAEIAAGRPVLLSGLFTGRGHIVLLIGLSADDDLLVHDPYGDWLGDYRSGDGKERLYPAERVWPILKDQGAETKWGLFFGAP